MTESVRIDRWLWAARFYKTRSLAQEMVEGGKVQVEGQRVKPGKPVKVGQRVTLRVGHDEREVTVTGLAEKRGSARDAALLYQESDASLQAREAAAAERKALRASEPRPDHRPSKKERRDHQRFRRRQQD